MTPEKAAKRYPHCGVEGHPPSRYFEYLDAYACMMCDEWLSTKCTDAACQFCPTRPERPSGAEALPV